MQVEPPSAPAPAERPARKQTANKIPKDRQLNSVIPEAPEREEHTVVEAPGMAQLDFPMKLADIKKDEVSGTYLTNFEKTEVEEYEKVYYLCDNKQKIQPTKLERLVNNGFDDEEGYYRI